MQLIRMAGVWWLMTGIDLVWEKNIVSWLVGDKPAEQADDRRWKRHKW
jgi:hypothetical protein